MVRVLRICYGRCYGMASIIQVGDKCRAQVRRRGHAAQSKSFGTKVQAQTFARRVESDIDSGRAGVLPKGALPIAAQAFTLPRGGRRQQNVRVACARVVEKIRVHVGFEADSRFGFYAPYGVPQDILARLNRDINRIPQTPAVKQRIAGLGGEAAAMTAAPFGERGRLDRVRFGAFIKSAEIKGD